MVEEKVQVGQIVSSLAGRDKDGFYIVVNTAGESIEVADGKLRRIEKPKKKNVKHLRLYPEVIEEIANKISQKERVGNAEIRYALANSDVVKKSEM